VYQSLRSGVIGIHRSPQLIRRRWPSRLSAAECDGGVGELTQPVASMDPAD
jgi:hypothetical protein